MSRFKGLLFVGALAFALAGVMGCSDDSGTNPADSGPKEGGTPKDTGPKATIDCKANNCNTFAVSRILLPTTAQEAQNYGYDYDGNTINDNALGSIISAVAAALGSGFEIQPTIDTAIYSGQALLLFDVQNKALTTDPDAVLQAHIGAQQACCPGDEGDDAKCKAAATAAGGCFGGSGVFAVSPTSPTDAIIKGKITGGEMDFGPAGLKIEIPLSATGTIAVNLKEARIKGKVDANGIMSGIISGVIPKSDLDTNVVPAVATLLQDALDDPNVSADAKKQITGLFDTDKDGKITATEVAKNALIETFLAGDVDVDNDGVPELSLGIGFEGVKATIGGDA
jgi:hypothetical protein